jgi:hypothetical protein
VISQQCEDTGELQVYLFCPRCNVREVLPLS